MKKISILLIFAGFVLGAMAQDVPFRKRAIYIKKTATWCGPCGEWGWDLNEEIVSRVTGRPFFAMGLHESTSSRLYTPASTDFDALTQPNSGVPNFYVNQRNVTEYSSSGGIFTTTTKNNVFRAIDSTGLERADIGTAFYTSVLPVKREIKVYTKTEIFNDIDGEYYLGLYAIEDNIIEYQASRSNTALHKNIFREALTPTITGTLVASGPTGRGVMYDTLTWVVPSAYDIANMKILAIIWKKDGNNFIFENSWSDDSYITTITSVDDEIDQLAGASAFVREDVLNYRLLLNEFNGKQISVDLLNINGQQVKSIYSGSANSGIQTSINTGDLAKGVYLVRTRMGEQVKTLKVVL
ncbi:MAG: T9SS type A sorting domain-containing protein [Bacteroidia bacterium]